MVTINENLSLEELTVRLNALENPNYALVDLSSNNIRRFTGPFPFPAWIGNVTILKFNGCRIQRLERNSFDSLVNVEYLYLNENRIKYFPLDLLKYCNRLRVLSLRHNLFRRFQSLTFQQGGNLRELDLSHNFVVNLRAAGSDTLEVLNLSHNLIEKYWGNTFKQLLVLNLSYNRIRQISFSAARYSPLLIEVDLSHNEIAAMKPQSFRYAGNLQTLRLNHNVLVRFDTGILAADSKLNCLELDSNQLETVLFDATKVTNLQTLCLSNNLNVGFNDLGFARNLQRFNFANCFVRDQILTKFAGLSALEFLDLSSNRFESVPQESFRALNNLKLLLFDYCDSDWFAQMNGPLFVENNSLKRLSLSFCNIQRIQAVNFRFLHSLTYLNLSHNKIDRLTAAIFSDLDQLQSLYLQSNRLTELDSDIFHNLRNLITIDLRNNSIRRLSRRLTITMTKLKDFFYDQIVQFV